MSYYIPDSGPDVGATRRTYIDRHDAIRDYLDTFVDTPSVFGSLVDFGAHNGRLARDLSGYFDDVIAIDDDPLLDGGGVVALIQKKVTARELGKIIREAEGNTLVTALSVLHHLPDWQKYVGAIERNAKVAIIETAHPLEVLPEAVAHDQSAAITTWCEKRAVVAFHHSPGWDNSQKRPMWLLEF